MCVSTENKALSLYFFLNAYNVASKGEGDRLYPASMADIWGKIARERCVRLESFLRNSEALK